MGAASSFGGAPDEGVDSFVNGVLADRMNHISHGRHVVNSSLLNPALSSGGRVKHSLGSLKSLKSRAMRSYSKQENAYIPHESILSASTSLYASKMQNDSGKGGTGLPTLGSSGSISNGGSKPGPNMGSFRKTPPNSNHNLVNPAVAPSPNPNDVVGVAGGNFPVAKKGLKPNLRINIQDDSDWIQVSDDEGGDDDVKAKTPRKELSVLPHHAQQSYLFTQSGTIFVDGFKEGIGKDGIHAEETAASKLGLHDRIVFLAKLGSGASGVVYKAVDLWEMRLVAVKMIPMFDRGKRRQCVREVSILFSILRTSKKAEDAKFGNSKGAKKSHEYIVDFYDAFSNIDDGGVAIMMEYMDGGSLQDIVNDGGCDDETTLAHIALQGLEGLAFLHDCSQLHRDLKPGNFLISKHGECKIADLGILRQMDPTEHGGIGTAATVAVNADGETIPRAQTFVGTATYMSPERIDGRDYTYPSDIWSFGLSLLTVALGRLPINTQGGYWTILQSIRDDKPPAVPDDGRFSLEFKDFIACMLQGKPEDRQSAIQLLNHPFLASACPEEGDTEKLLEEDEQEFGMLELNAILSAVAQHIDRRRNEQLRAASLSNNQEASGMPDSLEQVLGNLPKYTQSESLEKVFLSGRDLSALGLQLHLPVAKIVERVASVCEEFRSYNQETPSPPIFSNTLRTPKSHHGRK